METDAVGGQLIMPVCVSLLHMTDWDRDRENNQPALDLMDVVEKPKTGGWAVDLPAGIQALEAFFKSL